VSARRARQPETVEIVDLSDDGRGVAKGASGKTVFVHGALPGETVRILHGRRRRSHDEATTDFVLAPASERIAPGCAHFALCGGCSVQHLAPESQRANKERRLLRLLRESGVEPAEVFAPIVGGVWRYRRRARLGVRYVEGKGRVLVGFRERLKPYVAELESCPVLAPPADRLLLPLAELIGRLSIFRRLPQVELCVGDDRTALVLRVLDPPTAADLTALRAFERERDVDLWLQPGGLETVQPLTGPGADLNYRLADFDLEFRFGPTDFIQVNAEVNARLVARAVGLLAPTPGTRVLDLFCGIGNFSLALARAGAAVTGVEVLPALVERARSNARHNGLAEVEFEVADLFGEPAAWDWRQRRFDAVLLDPARAGAGPALPSIAATGAQRIVYVSCNPETLASDIAVLTGSHGYRLAGAGIVDMFPHTSHVESLALLVRGD
jgi:23S rRNA (uracil1939-C5)-methyltransferase